MITVALALSLLAVHIGGDPRYAALGLPLFIGGIIILHDGTTRMSNERQLIIRKPSSSNQPNLNAIIHTVRRFDLDGVPTSRREAERYGIDKQTWQATYDALKNIDAIERVDNRGSWRIRKTFTLDRIITQLSPLPR
jgi:hypothetical protein